MNELYTMGTKAQKIYIYMCARVEGSHAFRNGPLSVPKGMLRFPDLFKLFRVQGDFTFK